MYLTAPGNPGERLSGRGRSFQPIAKVQRGPRVNVKPIRSHKQVKSRRVKSERSGDLYNTPRLLSVKFQGECREVTSRKLQRPEIPSSVTIERKCEKHATCWSRRMHRATLERSVAGTPLCIEVASTAKHVSDAQP